MDGYCTTVQMPPENVSIWVCTFSQYQARKDESVDDIGPTVGEQLAVDPFAQVIQSVGVKNGLGMVAVHTTTADLYSRLWWCESWHVPV